MGSGVREATSLHHHGDVGDRRRWAPWAAAAAAGCACVALSVVDPNERQVTPPCPFRVMTGWWCPFCGGTRAVARLLRGDIGSALRYNVLVFVLIPAMAAWWAAWAFPERLAALRRAARHWSGRQALWVGVGAALVAFIVVRNVAPFDSWLRYPGA